MSLERLLEHRRLWAAKPVLARVYQPWFSALLDAAPRSATVLEVGAGPGFLGDAARALRPDLRWIASDLHPAAWNALAVDASRLPFVAGSLDTIVGLDVLHHLAAPADFFREAVRALGAQGRIALVEPWITPFSWLIYRFAHQEECRLSVDPWEPFPVGRKDSFDGDAAVPWRIVRDTSVERWKELGLGPPRVVLLNAFAYLLSLGFHPVSFLPASLAPVFTAGDRAALPFAPLTALRAALIWETTQGPTPRG